MRMNLKPVTILAFIFILLMSISLRASWALEIHLLSETPISNSAGYSNIFDMKFLDNRIYIATYGGLDPVYDVNDPYRPLRIFEIPYDGLWQARTYAIEVENVYYAYGKAIALFPPQQPTDFIRIYDVDGTTPNLIGEYYTWYLGGMPMDIVLQNDILYTIWHYWYGSTDSARIEILDANDPANIQLLGYTVWSGYPYYVDIPTSLAVEGNYLYAGTEGIRIFNAANPSSIGYVSKLDATANTLQQDDIKKVGNNIFKATSGLGIIVCSVAQSAENPMLVNVIGYPFIPVGATNIAFEILNDKLYVASGEDNNVKISVIDISDLAKPRVIAQAPFEYAPGMKFEIEVDQARNLIFLSAWSRGFPGRLYIYEVTEP